MPSIAGTVDQQQMPMQAPSPYYHPQTHLSTMEENMAREGIKTEHMAQAITSTTIMEVDTVIIFPHDIACDDTPMTSI